MSTTVTIKGQVTIPKAVRTASGIKAGDKVEVRATAGGVLIERALEPKANEKAAIASAKGRLDAALALLDRKGVKHDFTTSDFMRGLRDDD